jgi:hypothetical protein
MSIVLEGAQLLEGGANRIGETNRPLPVHLSRGVQHHEESEQ